MVKIQQYHGDNVQNYPNNLWGNRIKEFQETVWKSTSREREIREISLFLIISLQSGTSPARAVNVELFFLGSLQ